MTNKVLSNESKQENKNKEIIIKLLLDKYFSGNSNEISFSKKDCKNLNIPESDVTRIIYRLQEEGLLHIKFKSVHNNFSGFWTLQIMPLCVDYFKIKKDDITGKRRKSLSEFRAWITLIIAILAFLLSIFSLYLQFFYKWNSSVFSDTFLESGIHDQESSQIDETENHQNYDATFYNSTSNE